jgi:hypothetical protein
MATALGQITSRQCARCVVRGITNSADKPRTARHALQSSGLQCVAAAREMLFVALGQKDAGLDAFQHTTGRLEACSRGSRQVGEQLVQFVALFGIDRPECLITRQEAF